MYYHYGVDREHRDWPSLIDYLRGEIARLQPKKVLCVGTSSGGYAAIVAGHHLKADFVHAFGPQTNIALDREGIRAARHPVHRWRMSVSSRVRKEVLDLKPAISCTMAPVTTSTAVSQSVSSGCRPSPFLDTIPTFMQSLFFWRKGNFLAKCC
jgi:hypothetical protein